MKKAMHLSDIQDQDFIPILTEEDETAMQEKEFPEMLPLLSLRNTVLFPGGGDLPSAWPRPKRSLDP